MKEITTQSELDAAGSEWVRIFNRSVEARDNSHIEARDNSHVVARDNSHVVAMDNSHVVAWENSHVVARENSLVVARENSRVDAWDNSHVEAWENSHVVAMENSHIEARDNSHVVAMDFSSVVRLSERAEIVGCATATIITPKYPSCPRAWAEMKSIPIRDESIVLWKAVRGDGTDFHTGKFSYLGEIVAPDWDEDFAGECGRGLHLADSASGARLFVPDDQQDTFRLLRVRVRLDDCRCVGGLPDFPMKLRARRCSFVEEVPRDYDEYAQSDAFK